MRQATLLGGLLTALIWASQASAAPAQDQLALRADSDAIKPSYNISNCPGYKLGGSITNGTSGFTVPLTLAGDACNAYGVDIQELTLAVSTDGRR